MPREYNTYPFKGEQLTINQIFKLPECLATYAGIKRFINQYGVTDLEKYVTTCWKKRKQRVNKYYYKGKYYKSSQIVLLPECPHKDRNLFVQRLSRKSRKQWTVELALKEPLKKNHNKRENDLNQTKRKRKYKFNTEEIKKIMAIPVNPKKCIYYAIAKQIQEREIQNKGKSNE